MVKAEDVSCSTVRMPASATWMRGPRVGGRDGDGVGALGYRQVQRIVGGTLGTSVADDDDAVVGGHRWGRGAELEGIVGEGLRPVGEDRRADEGGVPRRADAYDVDAALVGKYFTDLSALLALGLYYRGDGAGLGRDGVVHPVGMGRPRSGRGHG